MDRLRRREKYSAKLTNLESFTSTFKALIGIGILACPHAFKEAGIYGGIFGVLFAVVVNAIMYIQLIKVIEKLSSPIHRTLDDITERILGKLAKILVEIAIICN